MANDKLEELYKNLLAANTQAFDLEEFNAAYHALMAALSCAASLEDSLKLTVVADVAAAELREIDSVILITSIPVNRQCSVLIRMIFTALAQQAKAFEYCAG